MEQETVTIYQWSLDAVKEMRRVWRDQDGMTEDVADKMYAAIISRHAPTNTPAERELRRDLAGTIRAKDARIAELEAENERLWADLSHACGKLRAIANGGPEIVDFDSVDEVREFARISLGE